jgi:hypothetical protein
MKKLSKNVSHFWAACFISWSPLCLFKEAPNSCFFLLNNLRDCFDDCFISIKHLPGVSKIIRYRNITREKRNGHKLLVPFIRNLNFVIILFLFLVVFPEFLGMGDQIFYIVRLHCIDDSEEVISVRHSRNFVSVRKVPRRNFIDLHDFIKQIFDTQLTIAWHINWSYLIQWD